MAEAPKNLEALEKATPQLIEKLALLTESLSKDEKEVFSEIIESAAIHTSVVQSHDEGAVEIVYAKPKSVHSTIRMKEEFVKLPETLGLRKR